jgi:hypothetical protein
LENQRWLPSRTFTQKLLDGTLEEGTNAWGKIVNYVRIFESLVHRRDLQQGVWQCQEAEHAKRVIGRNDSLAGEWYTWITIVLPWMRSSVPLRIHSKAGLIR